MKKLVLVALMATSAFAFNGKGMVELNGCFEGGCDTLDFSMTTKDNADLNDSADDEVETQTIALNYNYLFTNNFGAGLLYKNVEATTAGNNTVGDTFNTIGLNLFWNFDGGWESMYAAVRYNMTNIDETEGADNAQDKSETIVEFGKRMEMGKVFGMSLLYAPSVSYGFSSTGSDVSGSDDIETTAFTVNPVNFAVAF